MRSQKEGLTYTEPTFVRNSTRPVRIFCRIAGMTVSMGREIGLIWENRVNPGETTIILTLAKEKRPFFASNHATRSVQLA
jgi:hypothetical protein